MFAQMSDNSKPKILYVITRAERGGAQSHVLDLLRSMQERAEVALVTGEDEYLTQEARRLGVETMVLRELVHQLSPSCDFGAVRSLVRILRRFKPDLVHAHSSKAGVIARVAARVAGVPSVFTAHGFAFAHGAAWHRKLLAFPSEWIAGRLGDAVITVSQYDYQLARRYRVGRQDALFAIPNGKRELPVLAQPDAEPAILIMVARFSPPKDHAAVLHAAAKIEEPFQLWFIGDGPGLSHTKELAESLRMLPRTTFWGMRSDVPDLLAQSQVFVLASRHEGLPISVLEAMSVGLPVVASDVGGVRELVRDGKTGVLVPRGDRDQLRKALRLMITNPDLRARMGNAGRQVFVRDFSVTQMIDKTVSVYESVLRTGHAQSRLPSLVS